MTLRLSRCTEMAAVKVAVNLREADKEEARAACNHNPYEAAMLSFIHSDECYAILAPPYGPVAMFGVNHYIDPYSSIWMLGTPELESYGFEFLRKCRDSLDALWGDRYLYNRVYAKNTLHIKWLKWMGFTMEQEDEHGFLPFYRKATKPCVSEQQPSSPSEQQSAPLKLA